MDLRRAGWSYAYNTRGEVTTAQRTLPTAANSAADFAAPPAPSSAPQASYQYDYDLIGNRTLASTGKQLVKQLVSQRV